MNKKVKDPHVVAALLKLFFSSLPEPMFPFNTYEKLIQAHGTPSFSTFTSLFSFSSVCDDIAK